MQNNVIVPTVEQNTILIAVDDIPPQEWRDWLKSKGASSDQIKNWYEIKGHFQAIYQGLKDYFSGNELAVQYLSLSSSQRNYYALVVDHYIALYGVIQSGFKYIEPFFKRHKIPFEYETPGQLLIAILKQRSAQLFCEGLTPYHNFSPKKIKQHLDPKKVESEKSQKGKKVGGVQAWVEQHFYQKDIAQFDSLYLLSLKACEQAPKRDEAVHRRLQAYDLLSDLLSEATGKHLNHASAYQWVNGTRKKGTRGGGYS